MNHSRMVVLLACAVLLRPVAAPAQETDFLGKTPDAWAQQLDAGEPKLRRSAAFALGRIGGFAEPHLPKLLTLAQSDQAPAVREMAAMALGDIVLDLKEKGAEHWANCGPQLEKQLSTETDARARRGLLYALGAFGPEAAKTAPALRTALKDPSPVVRQNAAWALGRLGGAAGTDGVAELCKLLKDDNATVRRDAANALGNIGLPTAQAAVEPMLDLIDREGQKEGDPVVLKAALEKIVRLVNEGTFTLPPKAMAAVQTLGLSEPALARLPYFKDKELDRDTFLSALTEVLDKNEWGRFRLQVLDQAYSERNQGWAKRLQPHLKNDDDETAKAAAFALANISGPASRPAVEVLRAALKDDEDPQLQELAAAALGQMGHAADQTVPDLAKLLRSKAPTSVRRNCAVALGRIGPAAKTVMPQLIQSLKYDTEKELEVRRRTLEALFFIGDPENEAAIPTVVELLRKDSDPRIRYGCVIVLFKVENLADQGGADALQQLINEKDPDSQELRGEAARVLAFHLRDKAPVRAADHLLDMLKNSKSVIYKGANTRVEGAGEDRTGQANLKDRTGGSAKYLAAMALGWMGKQANRPEIVMELEKAAKGEDKDLARYAKDALEKIRK
jgi:HEAT repeat protein